MASRNPPESNILCFACWFGRSSCELLALPRASGREFARARPPDIKHAGAAAAADRSGAQRGLQGASEEPVAASFLNGDKDHRRSFIQQRAHLPTWPTPGSQPAPQRRADQLMRCTTALARTESFIVLGSVQSHSSSIRRRRLMNQLQHTHSLMRRNYFVSFNGRLLFHRFQPRKHVLQLADLAKAARSATNCRA